MTAFYNEHDPKAAAWLRELIAQGHIAPGVVDERSISDIAPDELAGFTQCHFFAGIGVWPLALRAAGWADDRPIWSGSCPCQPFSAAGKGDGFDDERHLWPDWHWLIGERRPAVVVGEQVASKDALRWLDLVSADMETAGYAFGAADLCAAGAGLEAFGESVWSERLSRAIHLCPNPVVAGALRDFADFARQHLGGEHGGHHIRQRAYFVGLADAKSDIGRAGLCDIRPAGNGLALNRDHCGNHRMAHDYGGHPRAEREQRCGQYGREQEDRCDMRTGNSGIGHHARSGLGADAPNRRRGDADWLLGRDGKWRAVEPGTFPLAYEAPARVGLLRGYGNALDFETALLWIETVKAHLDGVPVERLAA